MWVFYLIIVSWWLFLVLPMLKISPVSLSTLAYKYLRQWRRGYIYLSAYAGVLIRAAEFSPWINCSWKQCYSNVQAETVLKDCRNPRPTSIGLYGSIPYACGMSVIETSCPGDTPASLTSVHPWSSSFGTLLRTILFFLLPLFFMSCSQKLMWV